MGAHGGGGRGFPSKLTNTSVRAAWWRSHQADGAAWWRSQGPWRSHSDHWEASTSAGSDSERQIRLMTNSHKSQSEKLAAGGGRETAAKKPQSNKVVGGGSRGKGPDPIPGPCAGSR